MIPNQEKTVTISGSSGLANARSEQMKIDQESLPHLMQVLTNLYSDPEMAVIREISTNAYDSHVEAGKAYVPIQVTLPNVFSSQFVVKDFGVGLSETEVFEVFGMYGKSTKRESNAYVGQLGLGCKSPLTLTNQFSLTAVKNGVKCIFSIHLDESGVGKITKLHEENTDDGNGVEISVPIKDTMSFNRKARRFYRFFPVIPNFVGDSDFPQKLVPEVILELDDEAKIIKSVYEDESSDYVVMGGVAYPYRGSYGRRFNMGTVVMYAPIGAVDFTPSREDLHLTSRTKEFVETNYKKIQNVFVEKVQAKLSSSKDILELHTHLANMRDDIRVAGLLNFTYQGITFDTSQHAWNLMLPEDVFVHKLTSPGSYKNQRMLDVSRNSVSVNDLPKTAILTLDPQAEGISSYTKGILRAWMIENKLSHVIIVPDGVSIHQPYIDKAAAYEKVSDIRKKIGKKVREAKVVKNTYERAITNNWGDKLSTIEEVPDTKAKTVVFAPRQVIAAFFKNPFKSLIKDPNVSVFVVNKTNKAAFVAQFPEAVQIDTYLFNRAKSMMGGLSGKNELASFAYGGPKFHFHDLGLPYNAQINDLSKIQDNELVEALTLCGMLSNSQERRVVEEMFLLVEQLFDKEHFEQDVSLNTLRKLIEESAKLGVTEATEATSLIKRMQDKYPILLRRNSKEQYLIDYANMIAKGE